MLGVRDDHVHACAADRSQHEVVTREIPAPYPLPAGSSVMVRIVSRTMAFLIAFSSFWEIKLSSGQGRNESVWCSACNRVELPGDIKILSITAVARFWESFVIYIGKALFISAAGGVVCTQLPQPEWLLVVSPILGDPLGNIFMIPRPPDITMWQIFLSYEEQLELTDGAYCLSFLSRLNQDACSLYWEKKVGGAMRSENHTMAASFLLKFSVE